MAEDIVAGLFGLSPYQIQQQQGQLADQYAQRLAGMDGIQQAKYGIASGAGGLVNAIAPSFGMMTPAMQEAQARQAAMQGVDLSDPDSLLKRAAQIQDPQLKMRMIQYAQQQKAAQRESALKEAQTQATLYKATLEAAQAAKALRENPNAVVTEVGVPGREGWLQKVSMDKNTGQIISKIGDPYMSSALSRQTFHVSTGDKAPKTQIVTDNAGNSRLVNLETGAVVRDLGAIGKPSGTFEKTKIAKEQMVKDLDRAISELEAATKDDGLIDKSTGSGAGALIDMAAGFVGKATPGAIAVGQMKPIYDLVLKMVPRFEGPQSDKDTKSYEAAAGMLANPNTPNDQKKAAGKEILRLMRQRKGQFLTKDAVDAGVSSDGWKDLP